MTSSEESHYWSQMLNVQAEQYGEAVDARRPFRTVKPLRIFLDGPKWCILYGEDLQNGVAGFGDSPEDASYDFDKAWCSRSMDAATSKVLSETYGESGA